MKYQQENSAQQAKKARKRVKERSIKYVREKVAEWRRLHSQCKGKLNLDQVAKQIGISRKSLDDYSLQLRKAVQYGYDFKNNKKQRMGNLRKFVKDYEQSNPDAIDSSIQKIEERNEEIVELEEKIQIEEFSTKITIPNFQYIDFSAQKSKESQKYFLEEDEVPSMFSTIDEKNCQKFKLEEQDQSFDANDFLMNFSENSSQCSEFKGFLDMEELI